MKASRANYGDISQLVRVCKQQHEKSSWKELAFNPVLVKRNLVHTVRTDGMDALIVKDDGGKIHGVLLATVDQFFMNKMFYATDVHFMCDAGGIQLFAEFKRWAREHRASKIIMGIANDDPDGRIHQFYKAVGMRPVGDAWVMDLDSTQEMAA
jgi:hypothetical protein